jgi:hypothetical protein
LAVSVNKLIIQEKARGTTSRKHEVERFSFLISGFLFVISAFVPFSLQTGYLPARIIFWIASPFVLGISRNWMK